MSRPCKFKFPKRIVRIVWDPEFLRLTPASHIIHRLARNLRELTTIVSAHGLYVGHRNKEPDMPATRPGVPYVEHTRNTSM